MKKIYYIVEKKFFDHQDRSKGEQNKYRLSDHSSAVEPIPRMVVVVLKPLLH